MAEKRSRTDEYLFGDDRYTTHEGDDGRVQSTAQDVDPVLGRDHTEYRDDHDEVYGRSYENETVLSGEAYTEFEYEDGKVYTAWMEERTFSGDSYVVIRDRHGEKVGEAWLESAVFGGPTVKTEGTVPQGLASEMLGAREARQARDDKKAAKREKKARKKEGVSIMPGPDDGFFGLYWHLVKGAMILMLMLTALILGAMILAVALAVAAVASLAQFAYTEAVRRRLGPAVRLYTQHGPKVVWLGVSAGLAAGLLLLPPVLSQGDGFAWLVAFAGLAGGGYFSKRASTWISQKRLGQLSPSTDDELAEPSPVVLYGVMGVVAVAYLGVGVWLATAGGANSSSFGGPSYAEESTDGMMGNEMMEDYSAIEAMHDEEAGVFASETGEVVYANAPGDGFLAIRSQPSIQTGNRIDAIPHRASAAVLDARPVSATIDGLRGQWLRVRYGSTDGWVFDGYVNQTQPAAIETEPVGLWTEVRAPGRESLNLRAWSSPSSRIEGELVWGSRVYVEACRPEVTTYSSGKPGRWCQVTQDGRSGWAFDAYLDGVGR